jgi:hypothetical protein
MKRFSLFFLLCLLVFNLMACSLSNSDPSVKVVEKYIQALVNKDSAMLSTLSCSDWEPSARLEFDSLQAVETKLEGLNCSLVGSEGDVFQVNCKGKIIATYNSEDQEIDLSVRNYKVIQQGSDYLVCGYQ